MPNRYFKQWNDIDLRHLEPFEFNFESKRAKKNLSIQVIFTDHCFTEQDDSGNRVFNETRYHLSKNLKSAILDLNNDLSKVFECGTRRNWMYSIPLEIEDGYEMFFTIKRSNDTFDLVMRIESSYTLKAGKKTNIIGNMKFRLLCTKVYLKEKTSTKR